MQSLDELIALRKALHQTPELSNQEQATAVRIFNEFQAFSPYEVITDLGGTGLAFVFNGAKSAPTTLIRSELDALPIMVAVDSLGAGNNQIIGFSVLIDGVVSPDYLTKYSALNELCFIGDVVVSSAYSGQGIATKLLECCIEKSKEKRATVVLIERHEENLASAGMMRKAGFNVVETFYDPTKRSAGSRKTSILECRVG